MVAEALILHGWQNRRPEGHWQRWLAEELEAGGVVVRYPQLPEPDELVLTARAATPLAEIEHALNAHRQQLAFEPPRFPGLLGSPTAEPTLGGIVAAGFAGPRRPSAGSARDHVLGITALSGRAELFKGGGKVVKNVTGYDMPKLLAGSHGTLAVLTEVTVKVLPAPEDTRTLVIAGVTAVDAVRAMTRAAGSTAEYIFEDPPEEILATLLPRYVEMKVYHAMLESAAAEHAARMTAMDAATSNAAEMIDKLRRILFKSLGSLLATQEKIGETWKGRYAAEASSPQPRDRFSVLSRVVAR